MMAIPNIISPETPIGKDDSENVEGQRFLEPKVPDFEVPYHLDILEKLEGIDIDSARRTSGQGFIISRATWRACIPRCSPMRATS